MKYLISFLILFLISLNGLAQEKDFDFENAWELVSRLEIQGLPKSAMAKVDSIYSAAKKANAKDQVLKSVIYQSKFILLLEEEAQQKVITKLQSELAVSQTPERNILDGILAKLYLDYFNANSWQLRNRSKTKNPNADFLTWDSKTLLDTVAFRFSRSLAFDQKQLSTPIEEYKTLLTNDDNGHLYRPLLFDVLAHQAIQFLVANDYQRTRPENTFAFNDSDLFVAPDSFATLSIIHPDTTSYFIRALGIYQVLTKLHLNDTVPSALIDLTLARLSLVHKQTNLPNKDDLYLKALNSLKSRFVQHESSTLIDFKIAFQLNELADKYDPNGLKINQFKRAEALEICKMAIQNYPESFGATQCAALAKEIEMPEVDLRSEQFILPDSPTKILLRYKNYDSLFFSTYAISFTQYDKFRALPYDSLSEIFIKELELKHQWKATLKNEYDYQTHSTEVLFPPHALGTYLTVVSTKGNGAAMVAYDLIQVTNLAIVKTETDKEYNYIIINRNNGAPQPNVDFHVFTEGRQNIRIDTALNSNESGEVSFPKVKNGYGNITIELKQGNDKPVFRNNYLYGSSNSRLVEDQESYTANLQFFTDRAIYRPGQEVFFKGILIKQTKDSSEVVANEKLLVILYNPNREPLDSLELKTNEFGSITGSFTLPNSGMTGGFYIAIDKALASSLFLKGAKNHDYQTHYFSVEEYKRPKFEVDFETITEAYKINDSVFVKGNAIAFAGSSISNARVKYTVTRNTGFDNYRNYSYPRYPISDEVDLAEGEVNTDQSGGFIIPFKALIDSTAPTANQPVFVYNIEATVTDINGETHKANTQVKVAYHSYRVSLVVPNQMDRTIKSPRFYAEAASLNDQLQEVKGFLTISKLQGPKTVKRSAPWDAPDYSGFSSADHQRLFPHLPYQNEGNIEDWPEAKVYFKDSVSTGIDHSINLEKLAEWPAGQYKVQFTTTDPSGATLEATKTFELLDAKSKRVADNQLFIFSLDKDSYKPGEKAVFRYGTAAKGLVVTIWVKKGNNVVQKITETLNNEFKALEIPVESSDQRGFGISFFYSAFNSFHQEYLKINVPHIRPELNLEVGTFRNKLQPGVEETWSFKITGEKGEQMSAELLASMYDASLDQFKQNTWSFNPFLLHQYYSRGLFDNENSFSNTSFKNTKRLYPGAIPQLYYTNFNWFGLDFNNPEGAQSRYVSTLWWKKSPRPVISTKMTKVKEGFIEGIVLDDVGLPLPSVTIFTANKVQSIRTNSDGTFQIKAKYLEDVYLSFLGYKTFSFKVGSDNYYQIVMLPDVTNLEEVVIVGYGSLNKRNISSSILEVSNEESMEEMVLQFEPAYEVDESNSLPGSGISVRVRGTGSIEEGQDPLYVIDGELRSISVINPSDIATMEVLKGKSATALYGAQAINGVVIITTKKGLQKQNELLAQVKTRQNLNETAFFFPQLRTNEKGEVSFNFTSPESLTQWNLQLLAHSKNLASALLKEKVVTQKELMVLPNLPRFFRESDTLYLSAKVASLSLDTLSGFGQLQLFDAETNTLLEGLILDKVSNKNFTLGPKGSINMEWKLAIPVGIQAIRYKIVAATNDFSDGEESIIPVLPNRMMVQESLPLWVGSKSTNEFSLDKLKNNQSSTLTNHSLTLTMTTNPIWEAIQSLPYLIEYPYDCAEQTFSRYFANSLGSFLIAQNPSIQSTFEAWQKAGNLESDLEKNPELKSILIEETPWLREAKNETEQKSRMAMLFESQKMQDGLQSALSKLAEMQMSSGGFPWFAGSNSESVYISQHILTGLARLKSITGSGNADEIIENGISYLNKVIEERYASILKRKNADPNDINIGFIEVQNLYVRSLLDEEPATELLKAALDYYEQQAFAFWSQLDLQSQAMIALYAHSKGNKRVVKRIMKSLKERSLQSAELGIYWKGNQSGWSSWESPIETQAMLIEAFSTLTEDQKFVEGLKQWLLAQKKVSRWKSTKATTDAIFALISTEHSLDETPNAMIVKVGDETVLSNTIKSDNQEEGTGYFKKVWNTTEVKNEMAHVRIDNQNNTIAWGGLYWQYFEDLDKITSSNTNLSIEKELYRVKGTATNESLELITAASELALGELVRVRIVLRSDRNMEFIHLKDMRASGLEPTNVLSSYKWQDGLGYYESTRDAATHFFIEYLPKGTFVFEYDLRVNNKGEFSNGITSIENMYAPEFSSHSKGQRIKVGN